MTEEEFWANIFGRERNLLQTEQASWKGPSLNERIEGRAAIRLIGPISRMKLHRLEQPDLQRAASQVLLFQLPLFLELFFLASDPLTDRCLQLLSLGIRPLLVAASCRSSTCYTDGTRCYVWGRSAWAP